MAHKTDRTDLDVAFERFKRLTGDSDARLRQDGGYYWLEAANAALESYGKAQMYALLIAYCDGWEEARAARQR